jgi:hypothetical protein
MLEQKRPRLLKGCHIASLSKLNIANISTAPTAVILRSRALARRLEGWAACTNLVILRGSLPLAPQDDGDAVARG